MRKELFLIGIAVIAAACSGNDKKISRSEIPEQTLTETVYDTVVSTHVADTNIINKAVKHYDSNITQFTLVDVKGNQAELRSASDVERLLNGMGFKCDGDYSDDGDGHVKATRRGADEGVTTVDYDYTSRVMLLHRPQGYDNTVKITFADDFERHEFEESLKKSGWKKSGSSYIHRLGHVKAKISADRAQVTEHFNAEP